MHAIDAKLAELGIALPTPAKPVATYEPYVVSGNQVIVSGQLALDAGKIAVAGTVGAGVSVEDGQRAAKLCAINLLAQLKQALGGDWSQLDRCLRLGIFVNAAADFTDHPKVANGASDFIVELLGEQGAHARAAVGCSSLPLDSAVEVEGLFQLR